MANIVGKLSFVRTLRGDSRSLLCEFDDRKFYIVKYQGNPQGSKILVNELAAHRLATIVGLPVPSLHVVEINLQQSVEISTQASYSGQKYSISPGRHLASEYVISPSRGSVYDSLPASKFETHLRNPKDIIGAEIFDIWTANTDIRQFIYWKDDGQDLLTATMIDQGNCFGGPEWDMSRRDVLWNVLGFQNTNDIEIQKIRFEWACKIMALSASDIFTAFADIPPEWSGNSLEELRALPNVLLQRREELLRLVEATLTDDYRKTVPDRVFPRCDAG